MIQPTVTSGNTYVVPGTGTITSWSHNAGATANQEYSLKVFRKFADPAFYTVVSHDGPRPLISNRLNTFPASIPVKPGDLIGANSGNTPMASCIFDAPGDSYLFSSGLPDGQSGAFVSDANYRVNISAVFNPTNAFTLGSATRNKKKGTATITVNVPNPGELAASGKGVKAAGAAVTSKTVSPGQAQLLIKAKGKKKRKLNETGKVKLNVAVTYTPTGGDPSSQARKLKLKKKL